MKYLRNALMAALFGFSCLPISGYAAASTSSAVPINRIVAIVNNSIITENDLQNAMKAARAQFMQRGIAIPSEKEFRSHILQGLIYQKLQLELAKQNGIDATDKQINQTVQAIADQNHLSVEELKKKMAQEGVNFSEFKKQLKEQIIINELQQKVASSKITITSTELAKFKQTLAKETHGNAEYHIIDYLVALPDNATEQQKSAAHQLALSASNQLKQGKKPTGNIQDNDMGFHAVNDIPDLFAAKVVNMKDGDVSQPILAGNGYHIIQLVASHKTSETISDDQARQILYQNKFQKILEKWLKDLQAHSYVKIYEH